MPPFEDHAPQLATAVIILFVACAIVFPLRAYVRINGKIWGSDDWSIAIAAVPLIGLSVVCLAGSFHGIGVHQARLSEDEQVTGLMYFFLFEVFWCLAVIPTKLSISFMLLRIIGEARPGYTYSLWAISGLLTAMNLVALFYIVFRCDPVSYAWNTSQDGHCQRANILSDIYYAATAINIVFDYFCALVPIPLLWRLQLNRNAKISVACLLSLGVLASLSACIRLKYTIALTNASDYLYRVSDIVTWGYAEVGVGFFVACVATLRPLFRKVLKLGGDSAKSKDKSEAHEMVSRLRGDEHHNRGMVKEAMVSVSEENLVYSSDPQGIYVSRSVAQSSTRQSDGT